MRSLWAIVVLCATTMSAAELYIVPIVATTVRSAERSWRSSVIVTNPHDATVALRLVGVFGTTRPGPCIGGPDFPDRLLPHESRTLCLVFESYGAVAFQADDTVVVTSEMDQQLSVAPWTTTRQTIQVGHDWIKTTEVATLYGVQVALPVYRENLLVVNPNADPLRISYATKKMAVDESPDAYAEINSTAVVPGSSVAIVPVQQAPLQRCRVGFCGPFDQIVTVSGDAPFYVAASSVGNYDSTFHSPVISRR